MSVESHGLREQTIADYLAIVRRYKWLILISTLVVPFVAYVMSAQQPKVYRASADVLVNRQDLGTTVTGLSTQTSFTDADRYLRNEAVLARVPAVAIAAVQKAGIDNMEGSDLLGMSDVSPRTSTDVLGFGVNANDPGLAGLLVRAYAEAFTEYRLKMATTGLARARAEIQDRLRELRAAGNTDAETYRELVRKAQDLRTLEYLQAPASVLRAASVGTQIAPSPRRDATLGLVLGFILGVGGAFLLSALDRRIRHADEVERELEIPLLAKLPSPRRRDPATIVDRTSDEAAEAIARLRTSFDFANTDLGAKLVMVTSAGPREGKSTTMTNLGIALARTGRHVVLVDLDLRRPILTRLLHLPDGPGITDLARGDAELVDALQPVGVLPARARLASVGSLDTSHARLEVVSAGRTRVEPIEFVESSGLTDALRKIRAYGEIVLVDSPPILATGDAMALTAKVDAILLVSKLGTLTRPTLRELARVLSRSPAPVLGLVATGAELDEGYWAYTVDDYFAEAREREEPRAPVPAPAGTRFEVPDAPSASVAGSGRWTPRRGR